jgi:DegV family protein with EDD domain
MGNVAIVTDSTAYLPEEYLKRYGIQVVPNIVSFGTESYKDGVEISGTEFFRRVKEGPIHPTTSVASLGEFLEVYKRAARTADHIVAIFLSSKLSNTFSVGQQAAAQFAQENKIAVDVVDSQATAMGLGFIALSAAKAANAGKSAPEVLKAAHDTVPNVGVVFTVETLEYLRRGGRVSGASAFVGGMLDLKPILRLEDGKVIPTERLRSKKKAVERVIDIVVEATKGKSPIRLATLHASVPEEAKQALEMVKQRLGGQVEEMILSEISPSVGAHAGPGTVGLAYCAGI